MFSKSLTGRRAKQATVITRILGGVQNCLSSLQIHNFHCHLIDKVQNICNLIVVSNDVSNNFTKTMFSLRDKIKNNSD